MLAVMYDSEPGPPALPEAHQHLGGEKKKRVRIKNVLRMGICDKYIPARLSSLAGPHSARSSRLHQLNDSRDQNSH